MKALPRGLLFLNGAGIVLLIVAYDRWDVGNSFARDALQNLARCRALASELEALKANPVQASLQMQSQKELASLLDRAAKAAGISEASVASIRPEPNHRLAKTAYLEQPTRVELRQVSLEQLVSFIVEITAQDGRILPTHLRLTAPRLAGDSKSDLWQVEVILTHLVFSPESAS